MSDRFPMTQRGYQLLKDRLTRLKKVERPQNVEDIETARAHGDLSENAEYKYAKRRQSEIEGQLAYCETRIALAEIIDISRIDSDRVMFGATVVLADIDNDEEKTYMLVGEDEADIKTGLVNVNSPIAKGLIGKEEGDEVSIKTPGGRRRFEILEVTYTTNLPDLD